MLCVKPARTTLTRGGKPASMNTHSASNATFSISSTRTRITIEGNEREEKRQNTRRHFSIHPCLNCSPTARDALETNPESRPTQLKEGSDDESNRFNKQQKEGRRGRRRAERLRRKGRLNDLKQKTENSDTLEMLTEILMAPTVQTVAISARNGRESVG
ncbi:hypothetical protein BLNAU_20009 [Blattamonas nauphoetae]|uniref:Uncharacterized protein n=1 Tax=Blattamonas nauphoetae TaxID=2049346 RepID=A0ABQ9WZX6_9EUKA|nr:hypothetical protein BLNAU_20009 [Blattamonas nauphoetae]